MISPLPIAPYKFISLKTYASKEWLADNQKDYRQVYLTGELSYVYAEFTFFNKQIGLTDWDFSCTLLCKTLNDELICELPIDQVVSKESDFVIIREGWGMDEKDSYWDPGTYVYSILIEGVEIAQTMFHVIEGVCVGPNGSPFIKIESLKTYESDYDDSEAGFRYYFDQFPAQQSRYIWVEFAARNLQNLPGKSWPLELVFNFYKNNGHLKGTITEFITLEEIQTNFSITIGWGSSKTDTWYPGEYRVEVLFMSELIACKPFRIAEEFRNIEGYEWRIPSANRCSG